MVIGSEGQGLRDETVEACDAAVRIPMTDRVESLNAGRGGQRAAVAFPRGGMMDKTLAWLWLADAVGSGCQYARELLDLWPDPEELYEALRSRHRGTALLPERRGRRASCWRPPPLTTRSGWTTAGSRGWRF